MKGGTMSEQYFKWQFIKKKNNFSFRKLYVVGKRKHHRERTNLENICTRCNPRSKTTACNNALLCKVRRSIIEFSIRDKIAYKVLNLTLKLICFIYKFKVLKQRPSRFWDFNYSNIEFMTSVTNFYIYISNLCF